MGSEMCIRDSSFSSGYLSGEKMVLVAVGWQLLLVVLAMMGLVLVAMTIFLLYNFKPTATDMTLQMGNYASR